MCKDTDFSKKKSKSDQNVLLGESHNIQGKGDAYTDWITHETAIERQLRTRAALGNKDTRICKTPCPLREATTQ